MIDRKIEPKFSTVETIKLVEPQVFDLTDKVSLFWMKEVPNNTSKLTLFFDAGIIRGERSIPTLVNNLLLSGTDDLSTQEIHEQIDSMGGYVNTSCSDEGAVVTIYALKQYLLPIARIVANAIEHVNFRESEINELLASVKQNLMVRMQKVNYLCHLEFKKNFFQSQPNYAQHMQFDHLDSFSVEEAKVFLERYYKQGLSKIHVVGDLDLDQIDALIDLFGSWATTTSMPFESQFQVLPKRIDVPKKDAVQCAIQMGRFLFDRTHEDFIDFTVLNTLLGDYFGSRLMSNIREEKGYTYGIGSVLAERRNSGFFMISTEVRKEVLEAALNEIQHEIKRLQTEIVPIEELDLVRNYMLGELLKSADGPYQMLSMFSLVRLHNLDLNYYQEYIQRLKQIQPERIRELAQKYLNWDDFLIVTAGS